MKTPISQADPETHQLGLGEIALLCRLLVVLFLPTNATCKAAARWRGGRERGGLSKTLNFEIVKLFGFSHPNAFGVLGVEASVPS